MPGFEGTRKIVVAINDAAANGSNDRVIHAASAAA
jgi:hypothetical protein